MADDGSFQAFLRQHTAARPAAANAPAAGGLQTPAMNASTGAAEEPGKGAPTAQPGLVALGHSSMLTPDVPSLEAMDPLTTPITRMTSEAGRPSTGRLIAVNQNYICYTIRDKDKTIKEQRQIRVIHFVQVTRTKLAPHARQVTDMQFAGENLDTLASVDCAGNLFIRRIFESTESRDDKECRYNTELGSVEVLHNRV